MQNIVEIDSLVYHEEYNPEYNGSLLFNKNSHVPKAYFERGEIQVFSKWKHWKIVVKTDHAISQDHFIGTIYINPSHSHSGDDCNRIKMGIW